MKKISIQPINEAAIVQTGTKLLTALVSKDLNIPMSCGGKGICATCHVRVKQGSDNLSPMRDRERRTLKMVADSCAESRLACQAGIFGDDIAVEVPEGMYLQRSEDLVALLGTPAPENILHPIRGHILIPKGKLITRTLLEQSRNLDKELEQLRKFETDTGHSHHSHSGPRFDSTLRNSHHSTQHRTAPIISMIKAAPSTRYSDDSQRHDTSQSPFATATGGASTHSDARPRTGKNFVPEPGATIDKYLLIEKIGQGGVGVVYRALHQKLNCLVAIKFLRDRSTDTGRLQSFCAEARLLAQINHPNIVRVLDFEDSPEMPYVVMEYVDGVSGADLLKQTNKITLDRAINLVVNVSRGLAGVQHLGIVHRDIKPANILLDREGGVRLVDFGLAYRPIGNSESADGYVKGTPAYMSPEQIKHVSKIDHRADIYSLGATLFHLVTGQPPFHAGSPQDIMRKQLDSPIPLAHLVNPDLPELLSKIIVKMMEKDPSQRYAEYAELIADLNQLQPEAVGV
ncbi:MAG: protein kinase [Zavarzinella sp.]